MKFKTNSKMISKVLSRAVNFWLRSQIDQAQQLQIKITGSDYQILHGSIPEIFLASSHVVYQGLHLGQVQLTGNNIRINLSQIIKGKPLRLLEPIPVTGKILLKEAELNASVQSPLLAKALTDLLFTLLKSNGVENPNLTLGDYKISWQKVEICPDKLLLIGNLTNKQGNITSLIIRTGLDLVNGHTLILYPLQIETLPELFYVSCQEFYLDLGKEVELKELNLSLGQLSCSGCLNIVPELLSNK